MPVPAIASHTTKTPKTQPIAKKPPPPTPKPKDEFLFGSAVASYQVEKGLDKSDWKQWERKRNFLGKTRNQKAPVRSLPASSRA